MRAKGAVGPADEETGMLVTGDRSLGGGGADYAVPVPGSSSATSSPLGSSSSKKGSSDALVARADKVDVPAISPKGAHQKGGGAGTPRSRAAYAALAVLAVQNCSAVLVMRYTRSTPGQNEYDTQSAVVMQEVMKTATSMVLVLVERGELVSTFHNGGELLKTLVPAVLYLVQNNLQYVAVSNLHAATYQVTYQLKILSTALLSVCLLGRQLSRTKWIALVVLTAGVAAVQLSELQGEHRAKDPVVSAGGGDASPAHKAATAEAALSATRSPVNTVVGLGATLLATLSSGCAGVYFEKILKAKSELTLWQRNTQLGLYSIAVGLAGIFASPTHRATVARLGFFAGYTPLTYVNLAVQAFGGLVIAVVIRYADNILKNFATSTSIVFSVIISAIFLGQSVSSLFLLGVGLVIYAVFLYAR
mmetsp:Transcript_6392/g.26880  ORF Transcript_6392/g.26880 Transcript_6392/m.26880 type:complete len:419 (-) Transcript_6392:429-1685(-)